MNQAFICDGVRTPIGRHGGALAQVRADDLAAPALRVLLERHPQVDWAQLDDVIPAAPTRPEKTTATWHAWRCCWPECRSACPVPR